MTTMKPVPGYEGIYEASDNGHIFSVPRVDNRGHARGGIILKAAPTGSRGRLVVTLRKDGTRKTRPVHQLIAEAFHGLRPPGQETRHWDGNYLNNRADNLVYGTRLENAQDRMRHGAYPRGSRHTNARLTEDQVREMRGRYAAGNALQKALAREYGIDPTSVSRIVLGKGWTHVGQVTR